MLKDEKGESVDDQQMLQAIEVYFFRKLYEDDNRYENFIVKWAFPRLSKAEILSLSKEVSNVEIAASLFTMGGWKALSVDGLPVIFYQENWHLVRGSVCNWVKKVFQNPGLICEINNIFISLFLS